mmetsp:Transcript_59277/g.193354  ORF Transcript_59277/g.193354 Transcript_59277/m.193354 type:complete len:391 (-) Transcript_59277:419-1591(-)
MSAGVPGLHGSTLSAMPSGSADSRGGSGDAAREPLAAATVASATDPVPGLDAGNGGGSGDASFATPDLAAVSTPVPGRAAGRGGATGDGDATRALLAVAALSAAVSGRDAGSVGGSGNVSRATPDLAALSAPVPGRAAGRGGATGDGDAARAVLAVAALSAAVPGRDAGSGGGAGDGDSARTPLAASALSAVAPGLALLEAAVLLSVAVTGLESLANWSAEPAADHDVVPTAVGVFAAVPGPEAGITLSVAVPGLEKVAVPGLELSFGVQRTSLPSGTSGALAASLNEPAPSGVSFWSTGSKLMSPGTDTNLLEVCEDDSLLDPLLPFVGVLVLLVPADTSCCWSSIQALLICVVVTLRLKRRLHAKAMPSATPIAATRPKATGAREPPA